MLRDEVKSKSEEVGILEDNLKAKDEIIRIKEDYFCELQSELERLKTENEMKIIRIKELTNIISATNKEYQTLSIKKDEIMEENTEQNQETKNLNIKLDNKNLKSNKQKLHQLQEEIKVIGKRI